MSEWKRSKTRLGGPARAGASVHLVKPKSLRLIFHWQHPTHRFLAGLNTTLTPLDGAKKNTPLPTTAGSAPGKRGYDVPDDATEVEFKLQVKSPTTTLVELQQKYKVVRTAGSPPFVDPNGSNVAGGLSHPRMHSMSSGSGSSGTAVIDISIDLLFLDVTEHLKSLPTKATPAPDESVGRFAPAEAACIQYGTVSRMRVLEFTGGHPSAWPVILPPTLKQTIPQGVLLFLKNEALDKVDAEGVVVSGTYTDSDDANYDRALVPYWSSPAEVGKYVFRDQSGDPASYHDYPPFGWDKQLRDAKRSVIVLFPIPHSTDFGALDKPSAPASRQLLQSALTCLFCDSGVSTGSSSPPFLNHLAVGGWSSGTDTLFRWVPPATPKGAGLVDEFWVFDGKKGLKADVKGWFNADPSARRLRLIGTAYTEVASNALRPLASNPNVFVYPGDPKYWYRDPGYISSLAQPGTVPYRFRKEPTDPPLPQNDASTRANVYLKDENLTDQGDFVVQSVRLHSPGLGQRIIPHISHEEAATFVIYEALRTFTGGSPVTTSTDFAYVSQWVDAQPQGSEPKRSFRHRHPWSVFGGLFGYQGKPFVGYFQLCLEKSGL